MTESDRYPVTLEVNGRTVKAQVPARMLLVQFLRESLGLTGTHVGCDTSQCGACTVLLDAKACKSCTILAVQASGHAVTTIEGLSEAGEHPLQASFRECHALQCGYCTPGMIMACAPLLERPGPVTEDDVIEAIDGNLCRCTGYRPIIAAILNAAQSRDQVA
jgi:carbon-monoxide dehydrogenase small subunit